MRLAAGTAVVLSHAINIVGLSAPAFAQAVAEAPQQAAFAPLDGLEFDAGIVRQGDSAAPAEPLLDRLFFANGMFSSKICERYGFVPGAYWVRGTPEMIEFSAVLHSPTDGVMEWKGTVTGGKLDGTMRWTRERWYWTIEAEHRISGQIATQPSASSTSD